MYHSVEFTVGSKTYNTWDDWYLVPSSRPVINPPEPKTFSVDLPGANGELDLTTVLTDGEVKFSNRTGDINFIVWNDKPYEWYELYSEISNAINGQYGTLCLVDDDSENHYEGRFKVTGWTSGSNYSSITIEYNLKPFKYSNSSITLLLTATGSSSSNGTWGHVYIGRESDTPSGFTYGGAAPVTPTITVTNYTVGNTLSLQYGGTVFNFSEYITSNSSSRVFKFSGFRFTKSQTGNSFVLYGSGAISISWTGGSL